ncbi:FAD-dependent oxidoreductase [Weissella confusa]|uniref:FAD-dependent oxidoreductase n=1 Tax=Weissella confusa TaxID=1583 RepID=A0A923NFY1_WEICO|nr:FAD-dependent oxidoreductase [Weissella confusa]
MDDRGIRIYFNTEVTEVSKTDDGYSATLSFGSTIPAGVVVRAVGRVGNNDTLQLENAGVEDDIHGAEYTINSEQFLSLAEMPEDIVIIGGGYIAVEFASIAAAAGAQVHLVVRGSELLSEFDEAFVDTLFDQMRFTEAIPDKTVHSLDANGIGHIYGAAHFINEDTVIVHGDEDVEVQATDWILTVGQRPAELEIPGSEDVKAAGKSVVLIEKYLWGGTCPNYGCDPKKILLAAVEAKEHVDFLRGDGVDGKVDINWEDLMGRQPFRC